MSTQGPVTPTAYPAEPLWRGKDHQWTAVKRCDLRLTALLCHVSFSKGHIFYPHKAVLWCIVTEKTRKVVFTFTWCSAYDGKCSTICIEFVYISSRTNTINTQSFVHIFVIRRCLRFCHCEIFSFWHPVDRLYIFPSMQQNNILKETSLCPHVIFQQQWFLKYSQSYWVNLQVLQGCQGNVYRMCFSQQLLFWVQSSIQKSLLGSVTWVTVRLWGSPSDLLCSFRKM